jgi:hypothetical protein
MNITDAIGLSEEAHLICSTSAPYPVLFANRAWTKITGYEQHEVVGQDLKKLQGPLTNFKKISNMMEHIKDNGYGECEVINYTKDQSPYNTKISVKPVIGRTSNNEYYISHYFAKVIKTDMADDKTADPVIFGLENAKEYSWFVESMSKKGSKSSNASSSSNDDGSQSGSATGSASDEMRRDRGDVRDGKGGLRKDDIDSSKKKLSQNGNSSHSSFSESTGFHSHTGVTTNEEDPRSESDHYSSKDGHNYSEVASNHSSSEKSDADSSGFRARSSSSSSSTSYPRDSYNTTMIPVLNFKSSQNSHASPESFDNLPYHDTLHKARNNSEISDNKGDTDPPSLHNTVSGSSDTSNSSSSEEQEQEQAQEEQDHSDHNPRKRSSRHKTIINNDSATDKPSAKRTRVPRK